MPATDEPPRESGNPPGWLERIFARETSGGAILRHVDGLRCVAILCVLAYHINGFTVAKTPYSHDTTPDSDLLCRLFAEGHLGVQLFFVISGFILALPFAGQFIRGGRPVRLRDYFLRRLIRLEPPYLIALAIMTAAAVFVQGHDPRDLLPHLLASAVYGHYFLYGRGSDILPVAWSLEIEAQFYLLAPLLAAVFRVPTSTGRRVAILLAIVTAGGLQSLAEYPPHSPMHGWTILSAAHWFLAGFLLADCQVAGDLEVSPRSMSWDVAGCVAWVALFLVVQQRFHLHVLGPLLALVACAAAFKGSRTRRLLSRPAIYLVGGMCYTIYLYHGLLKAVLGRGTIGLHAGDRLGVESAAQIVLLVPPIIAVCGGLFLAFEKPFMSRGLFERVRRRLGWHRLGHPGKERSSMRCLVVSPVFPPEPVVSSQTTAHVADAMAGRGHAVTVVTSFPSRPAGRLYPGYSRRACSRKVEPNGIELVRCFSLLSSTSSMAGRFLENLSFGMTSGWIALTTRRPDVIYANSWPIFATGILAAVARLRGIPLVISVQDVYPESLVSQGRVRPEGRIVRLLRSIDRRIVRSCRAVIVISESFADIYLRDRGVPPERLHVVPNWVDAGSVEPDSDLGRRYRSQRGLPPDAFVVVYGGNVGAAAGVECVIEAMRFLDDVPQLRLLVAGEGTNLDACRELSRRIGDDRVLFHAPYRLEENSMVLGAADVLVLPTRGEQSLASVPSKLLAYMLAGRPIVAAALPGSDLAATIERSGCGWVVEPDRPESLAATLREVSGLGSDDLCRRGLAGREFALRNFTREACLPKVVGIVEGAARQPVDQRITSSTAE